jgi:hypothetical protein
VESFWGGGHGKAAIRTRRLAGGSRLVGGPRVQHRDKRKTVGLIWPTVRGVCVMAALPPVSYLEVSANLPRPGSPKGEAVRRVSGVLFITSTSDTTTDAEAPSRDSRGARGPLSNRSGAPAAMWHPVEESVVFRVHGGVQCAASVGSKRPAT